MATPTLKYVAPTTAEDDLTFAPEPVVIYGVPGGGDSGIQSIVAGTNVTVDDSDPFNPVISATGGGGGGAVDSVNGQTGVVVLDAEDVGAAPTNHTQAISTITGLQAELDSKATPDEIPTTPADIGAATAAQGTLANTAVQPAALASYVPNTRTVAGKALSANVTLVKGDVGLGSVDNTADSAKPVSTAQAAAIATKVNTADVAGLNTVGWGRAVFIANGGTVPGGTPAYTIVIEAGA